MRPIDVAQDLDPNIKGTTQTQKRIKPGGAPREVTMCGLPSA